MSTLKQRVLIKGSHEPKFPANISQSSFQLHMPPKKTVKMGTKILSRIKIEGSESPAKDVVTELITEKYQSRLSLCMERMLHRRLSRDSKSSTDDGFSSSYSSRVGTPDSICSGRSYFSLCYHTRKDGDHLEDSKSTFSLFVPVRKMEGGVWLHEIKNGSGRNACSFANLKDTKSPSGFQIKECTKDVQHLTKALTVQNGIITQISKALSYCKKIKSSNNSDEYLEAERILLVAILSREAISTTLGNLEFDHEFYNESNPGTVEISKIHFYADVNVNAEKMTEYFVMVISCGQNVLSSQPLVANGDGEIVVGGKFRFEELPRDFEITIAVYSMLLKTKRHKLTKPGRLISKALRVTSKHTFNHSEPTEEEEAANLSVASSFAFNGSGTMKISDFGKTHFTLENIPKESNLHATFTSEIASGVKLNHRRNGFLTVGVEQNSCLVWNLSWCLLEGRQLKYWREQSREQSEPIEIIELENCTTNEIFTSEIFPADRITCPKAKSLILSIKNANKVEKYFLFPDTLEEMELWHNDLNGVINALRCWGCLRGLSETLI